MMSGGHCTIGFVRPGWCGSEANHLLLCPSNTLIKTNSLFKISGVFEYKKFQAPKQFKFQITIFNDQNIRVILIFPKLMKKFSSVHFFKIILRFGILVIGICLEFEFCNLGFNQFHSGKECTTRSMRVL